MKYWLLLLISVKSLAQVPGAITTHQEGDKIIIPTIPNRSLNLKMKCIADAEGVLGYLSNPPSRTECNYALKMLDSAEVLGDNIDGLTEFEKGFCLESKDSFETAIEAYSNSISFNNGISDFTRDSCYYKMKVKNGYSYYKPNSCKSIKHLYNAYMNRAYCKFRMNDYRGAIADYSQALLLYTNEWDAIQSDKAICYEFKGFCEFELKRYADAKSDLTSSIEIDDSRSLSFVYRAFCNLNLGNTDTGCSDFSKAGELGDKEAFKYIKQYCQ